MLRRLLNSSELSPSSPYESGVKAPTMLSSFPTSSSSSGWLDRLRTSKGFPIPYHIDLEHFLHTNFEPNPNPTPPDDSGPPAYNSPIHRNQQQQSHNSIRHEKEQRLFDLMNNVLSELFVMGDPQESAAVRKSARKQMTPKVCLISASASADVGAAPEAPAMSPSSADNSVAEEKIDRRKMKRMRATAEQAAGSDPSMNIGTVVTVIDTSSPGWKSEKHFRKGMSWKGREKKMWNVCRKKRKMGLVEKLIVEKEPLMELKGREQKDNVKSHPDEGSPQNNNGNGAKESDYCIHIPRRPKFLRSPRLPVKNSSLFRLQVIPKNHRVELSGCRGTPNKAKS